ncbi:MAG TPA: hypothetical protein VFG04_07920 [Planctomycetaceae bacterium]|jgi:hypothetical protein|nr:hypothetical protein [Planctomycetaceae bacterium]
MLLAANVNLLEGVLLATIVACGTGFLWRTLRRANVVVHSTGETEENERAQARAEGRIADLEVRLHDFAREVEARMETRALQLDSLVVAGDREIVRLSAILNRMSDSLSPRQPDVMTHFDKPRENPAASATTSAVSNVLPAQVEMAGHLDEAGYNVAEIAHIIGHDPEVVRSLLKKAA